MTNELREIFTQTYGLSPSLTNVTNMQLSRNKTLWSDVAYQFPHIKRAANALLADDTPEAAQLQEAVSKLSEAVDDFRKPEAVGGGGASHPSGAPVHVVDFWRHTASGVYSSASASMALGVLQMLTPLTWLSGIVTVVCCAVTIRRARKYEKLFDYQLRGKGGCSKKGRVSTHALTIIVVAVGALNL